MDEIRGRKILLDRIDKILTLAAKLLKILTLFLLIIPPFVVAINALSPNVYSAFPPSNLSLKWFHNFFSNSTLLASLQNSFLIAVIVVMASLTIGTPASYAMVRYNFKAKQMIDVLTQVPLVFPGVAFGNALLIYFYSLNYYDHLTMLILGQIIIALPFVFRAMIPGFYGLSTSFEEASLTLGANRIQTFVRVTLPLVKPSLVSAAILAFAASFNDYAVSVFLNATRMQTLPVQLMSLLKMNWDPTVAAASTFTTILMLFLLLVVEKLIGLDKIIIGMRW